MITKDTLCEGLTILSSAYPKADLPQATLLIYSMALQDLPEDIFNATILECVKEYTFFPTIAEIMEVAFQITRKKEHIPDGYEAWNQIKPYANNHGKHFYPHFKNKFIEKTIQNLGWINICNNSDSERIHSKFIKVYEDVVKIYIKQITGQLKLQTSVQLSLGDNNAPKSSPIKDHSQGNRIQLRGECNDY